MIYLCICIFYFPNRTITNIASSNDSGNENEENEAANEDEKNTEKVVAEEFHPFKRRRSSSNGDHMKIFENLANSMKENNSKRNEIYQKLIIDSKENSKNDLELYFDSICKTVSKFNSFDQVKIKMKISHLVNEAELQHLESIKNSISTQSNIDFQSIGTISFPDGSSFSVESIDKE